MRSTDGPTTRSWRTTTRGRPCPRSRTRCRCAIQLASGRSSYSILGRVQGHRRRRGRQHHEDPAGRLLPRRAGNVGPHARHRRRHQRARRQASHGPGPAERLAGAPGRQHRRHRLGARPLARRAAGHPLGLVAHAGRRRAARVLPARRRPERDALVVAGSGAARPGRRRPVVRGCDTPPVVALRRLRRHPQPGLRPDRARGRRVDRGRLGDRAPGAVVLRQRRRRVLLVVLGRAGRRPSRRRGGAAASRISCRSATATTAPRG